MQFDYFQYKKSDENYFDMDGDLHKNGNWATIFQLFYANQIIFQIIKYQIIPCRY